MDIAFFLRERIQFIRQLYLTSVAPFEDRKGKIEKEEEPFVPPYTEDDEPAFLAEWQEAEDSIQVLGCTCLSMLSSSLKLYFVTVEQLYSLKGRDEFKADFKNGFIAGYAAFFRKRMGIQFEKSPCDLSLLEEVVLIRNAFEHPAEITSQQIFHPVANGKSTSMFFCRESELQAWKEVKESDAVWMMALPRVHTDQKRILEALDNVKSFCDWLEEELTKLIRSQPSEG